MTGKDRAEFEAWLDYWWDTTEWSDDDKEEGFLAFKAARRTQSEQVGELVEAVSLIGESEGSLDGLCVAEKNTIDRVQGLADALAAQLKEQDDDE